jgi:hypothetical protein
MEKPMTNELTARVDQPCVSGVANGCELCGDQPEILHLHARCHLTAPLRAELDGETLTLFCYLPECSRKVASFKLAAAASNGSAVARAAGAGRAMSNE